MTPSKVRSREVITMKKAIRRIVVAATLTLGFLVAWASVAWAGIATTPGGPLGR